MKQIQPKQGFTIVEIMITIAIIGLLAALGIPNMLQARQQTQTTRFAREILNASHAFTQYALENNTYPADKNPTQMPEGMSGYLNKFPWSEDTLIGGNWDWDYKQFGITAGVSVWSPDWDDEYMKNVDKILDDGNLSSGQFRKRSGGYILILEI